MEVTGSGVFKRIPWKTQWPRHIRHDKTSAVYIGIGTNIGTSAQRRRMLHLALQEMNQLPTTRIRAVSSLYQTPPWGNLDQPDFFNAVAAITTGLSPAVLLKQLKRIETKLGRKQRARWGPREIDLDIALYRQLHYETPDLRIPHLHLHQRPFVTIPLIEIAGPCIIPPAPPSK